MTTAYDPRADWIQDDRQDAALSALRTATVAYNTTNEAVHRNILDTPAGQFDPDAHRELIIARAVAAAGLAVAAEYVTRVFAHATV